MVPELDRIEEALADAAAALAAAEPQVWRSLAARAYAVRLAEAQDRVRHVRSGVGAARAAVVRLEAERAARAAARVPGVPW